MNDMISVKFAVKENNKSRNGQNQHLRDIFKKPQSYDSVSVSLRISTNFDQILPSLTVLTPVGVHDSRGKMKSSRNKFAW